MNTIFKIIWNHTTQSFVVASELAKGHAKSSTRTSRRVFNLTRIGAALSLALGSSAVMASLPVSGTGTTCVVDGITVACADGSQAVTSGSIAIGENAIAGIAVGNSNNVSGEQAMAIGTNAQAKAQDSIAQGTEAKAYGESNIAIGKNARSGRGKKGFATSLADEPEANSIAIGNNAQAPNQSSIAMGDGATVQYFAPDAIAIGTNAKVGTYARTSIAIGKEATAKHFYNTAIGPQTVTDGVGAAAVGFSAQALGRASFAAGQGAKTENQATVAIGENAKVTLANNVSLGSRARDRQAVQINDATVQGISYSGFAGKAKAVVSVGTKAGERQIINVAPGEISKTSTDAINGSQLYLVAEGLTNQMPVVYTNKDGNKVYKKPDGTFVDGKGNPVQSADVVASMNNPDNTTTNPTTLTNIAGNLPGAKPGTTAPTNTGTVPTDVKTNNAASVGDVLNAGWNLQGNSSAVDFVKPYDTVNFINGANTSVSVTTADNLTNEVRVNVTGLPISYTNEAGDTLVKVGDNFYKASDVVNGKPIDNAEAQTPAGTTLVDGLGAAAPQTLDNVKSAINPDGSKTGDTFTTALDQAASKSPNKAVNVSDLKNVSDNIRKATVAAKTTVTSKNGTITVVKTTDDTTKADNYDLSVNAQGVTNNAQLPVVYTNKKGEKVYKQEGGTFNTAIDGKGTTVQPDDVIASMNNGSDNTGPTQLANVDSAINGQNGQDFVEKLKKASADDIAKNSAVNVSDLQNTTDALIQKGLSFAGDTGEVINKKLNEQLDIKGNAAKNAAVTDKNIRVDSTEGALIVKMAKMLQDLEGATFEKDGQTLKVENGGIVIVGKNDAGEDKTVKLNANGLDNGGNRITNVGRGTDKTDAVNVEQLEEVKTSAGAGGFNVATNGEGAKKIGNGDTVDFVNGNNTVVSKVDTPKGTKVKIDLAKDLKGLNSVELKDPAGNTTNVTGNGVNITGSNAAGKPVNVSLTANGLDNGGNRITNVAPGVKGTDAVNVNQLNAVSNRIGDVDRKARGGIAGATAMANLPQAYIPGHSMVAVAAGTHRGANAVAVGVSRISDSGHVIIKLSGSTDSKGGTNAGVGVGYQW